MGLTGIGKAEVERAFVIVGLVEGLPWAGPLPDAGDGVDRMVAAARQLTRMLLRCKAIGSACLRRSTGCSFRSAACS